MLQGSPKPISLLHFPQEPLVEVILLLQTTWGDLSLGSKYLVQPRHPPDTPVPPSTPGHAMESKRDCKSRCKTWVW